MKTPGEILLVSCYESGHQPFNLASPLGFLKSEGFPAVGIDAAAEKIPSHRIKTAKFIGISVPMHTAMCIGVEIAFRIKKLNPQVHLCFYGLYAVLNADYLLSHLADSVIGGEFETPLVRLITALDDNKKVPPDVRTSTTVVEPFLERMTFSESDRRGLPELSEYAQFDNGDATVTSGYTETTRGCLHTCLHCPITPVYAGRFFVVPNPIVSADVRKQIASGAKHITFGDPDFLNGPGHSLGIARELHTEYPHVTFDITTKIEHILEFPEIFPELQSLGCAFVVSAVESVSKLVLRRLKKGHTANDIVAGLEILNAAGIPMRPSLVAFTPWTTQQDYTDMLTFVEHYDLIDHIDPVQYTIRLLVPPGSALLKETETAEWIGPLDQEAFQYRWTHPDSLMDELQVQLNELVSKAAGVGEDPLSTFNAIKARLKATTGQETGVDLSLMKKRQRRRIPRLTESWFC
ncbi:MAG: radical SAM protein [Candidatus Latescibacteria bacterium]|nr:radical SAM protein [Candidatus Latescibacterota bacterium]